MATPKSAEVLVVLESFIGRVDTEDRFFRTGELIRPDDPAVKKWPAKFGPATFLHDTDAPVERAAAAPGEKRA